MYVYGACLFLCLLYFYFFSLEVLKYVVCLCRGCCVSVCIVRRGDGKCECFVMQMLYVCVLCASCGSSQCCVLHDLQFVNAKSRMQ